MYREGLAAGNSAREPQVEKAALQTINERNVETIKRLSVCIESLDHLVNKVSGPQPADTRKDLAGVPSMRTHADIFHQLTVGIEERLQQLHQVIGD